MMLVVLLLGGAASHPVQPALQAETDTGDDSLLHEMGQPMCERPWSTACPIGHTCDREPVGFWCGQYDDDLDACVHQFEWQPLDDSLRPCHVENSCENSDGNTDECESKRSRCTTGSSATECVEPAWTTRGLLDLRADDVAVTLDADSDTSAADASEGAEDAEDADAAGAAEDCGEWTGLPEDEATEMQCGVFMFVHQPNAGSERMYSYFDQKARGEDADARNGWEFFNLQWPNRKCAGQPCFDGWDLRSEKWATFLQKVRLSEKPKLIVHLYNVFPGLGMGFLESAVSPLQAQLEAKVRCPSPLLALSLSLSQISHKQPFHDRLVGARNDHHCTLVLQGCMLKLATTLREPTAHALAHAFDHGIGSKVATLGDALPKFVSQWSNHQTKYLLLNKRLWPAALHENNATLDDLLLPSAQDLLSRFGLVGRHEEMPSLVEAVNQVLGWPTEWSLSDLGSLNEVGEDMPTTDTVGLVADAHNLSRREMRFVRKSRLTDDALYRSFCNEPSPSRRNALRVRQGKRHGKGVAGHDSGPLRELLSSLSQKSAARVS